MLKDKKEFIKLLGVFVIEVLIVMAISFGKTKFLEITGFEYNILVATLILDILLVLVTVLYTRMKGEGFLEAYNIKKIKVGTVFLTLFLTMVASPMFVFANVFSQLFVPNTMVQSMDLLMNTSLLNTFIAVAIIAPISEELIMRGFFQNRFDKIMPFAASAILSGFLFGVLHLNFNQFCYAWVLGILFAYTNRASGSTVTSILMHFFVNGSNTIMLAFMKMAVQSAGNGGQDIGAAAESVRADGVTIKVMVVIFGVLAIGSFFISRLLINVIAKHEGTMEVTTTE